MGNRKVIFMFFKALEMRVIQKACRTIFLQNLPKCENWKIVSLIVSKLEARMKQRLELKSD